ncbi:YaaA family protein [Microbacterium sp. P07]|uniref:YaaA family protein n=1 Tax=Microbacterium sp. P07 TaxID=3366952 RepID=UPI003744EF09
MLILLPPSETKRPGGRGRALDLDALAFAELRPQREAVASALVDLSRDEEAAARVLKLSARQRSEIAANAAILSAATMPAADRYTGVLYDALDAQSLDASARRWLGGHVLIQSALFGPISALDRIPAYRLSAGTALPGLAPLRRVWADAVESALSATTERFVLDLRSEAYAALGPVPASVRTTYLRVVTEIDGGAARALNHFNKHSKGALARALAAERPRISRPEGLIRWAASAGWRLRAGAVGETELIV